MSNSLLIFPNLVTVKFSCFCIYLQSSFLFIDFMTVDCGVFHYVLQPYFLMTVSPLALYICSPFLVCLPVDHCVFGKFLCKLILLVICLLFVVFPYLISAIILHRYGGGWHVSHCSGFDATRLYHSDPLIPLIVVFGSMPIYCSMHPWFIIFTFYH